MATAVPEKNAFPWASRLDETGKDLAGGVTDLAGQVHCVVTFDLVGTVTQVQADLTTLAAATITATSGRINWTGA